MLEVKGLCWGVFKLKLLLGLLLLLFWFWWKLFKVGWGRLFVRLWYLFWLSNVVLVKFIGVLKLVKELLWWGVWSLWLMVWCFFILYCGCWFSWEWLLWLEKFVFIEVELFKGGGLVFILIEGRFEEGWVDCVFWWVIWCWGMVVVWGIFLFVWWEGIIMFE